MRKLFLLFVVLCSMLTAKAADSNYSLHVWEGGLEKIEGVVSNTLKFQTTANPNVFVINVNNGTGQDLTKGAQFNFKIGETHYKAEKGVTKAFTGGIWNKGGYWDGASDPSMSLGENFKCVRIMLYFVDKNNYYIDFQKVANDNSSPFKLYTWEGGAFHSVVDTIFQIDNNSRFSITISGGVNIATDAAFLVSCNPDLLKSNSIISNITNQWETIINNNGSGKDIGVKANTYYNLYLQQPNVNSTNMQIYASTVPPTAPQAFTVTAEAKCDILKGKNIFLGFKASWTKVAPQAGYTISYKLTYKKDNVAQELTTIGDINTATLYGIDGGDITVSAVYTNLIAGLTITSDPATATYTPIDVVQPVAIDAPRQLKRYGTADDSNIFSSTLSWAAHATYPALGYDIKQADATKATPVEADYEKYVKMGDDYQYTALADIMIEGITNIKDADPVKVNYIVIPRYSIGNTVMTVIDILDFAKKTDIIVKTPAFAKLPIVTAEFTKTLVPTGVEGIESGKAAVYPNPTTGAISITATEAINDVLLYNLSGGLVAKFNGGGESAINIDITDTSTGTYFLKVGTQVTKIIKK